MNGIDRLLMLRADNEERGRCMQVLAPRFERIANRHIEGTAPRAVTGFNLFQTPPVIAARMADILRERVTGGRILEPSAGLGRLLTPLEEMRADWEMVEEAKECINALQKMLRVSGKVWHADFLTTTAESLGGRFDGVIMNPPFKMGSDVKHIQHAASMLKPGGRLVSLCYNGTKQNAILRPIVSQWHVLPAGSFKTEGTGADVALVVIDK